MSAVVLSDESECDGDFFFFTVIFLKVQRSCAFLVVFLVHTVVVVIVCPDGGCKSDVCTLSRQQRKCRKEGSRGFQRTCRRVSELSTPFLKAYRLLGWIEHAGVFNPIFGRF